MRKLFYIIVSIALVVTAAVILVFTVDAVFKRSMIIAVHNIPLPAGVSGDLTDRAALDVANRALTLCFGDAAVEFKPQSEGRTRDTSGKQDSFLSRNQNNPRSGYLVFRRHGNDEVVVNVTAYDGYVECKVWRPR